MSGELPLPPVAPVQLVADVEAILFVAGEPVGLAALTEATGAPGEQVADAVAILVARSAGRGVEVVPVAGGWWMRTSPPTAAAVSRWRTEAPLRPSRAALEVLAAVAWRQPVTRGEIEAVRGVDSQGPLRWLIAHGLVRAAGRRDEPGRPTTFATTDGFLELLQLPSLDALPPVDALSPSEPTR